MTDASLVIYSIPLAVDITFPNVTKYSLLYKFLCAKSYLRSSQCGRSGPMYIVQNKLSSRQHYATLTILIEKAVADSE